MNAITVYTRTMYHKKWLATQGEETELFTKFKIFRFFNNEVPVLAKF